MIRVAVWGPGSMGLIALRAVIDRPGLELVNLVAHSPAKIGVDAGRLCGIGDIGVVSGGDPAEILDGDADVVVYAAAANTRPFEAIADMAGLLAAGKDVVSCSVVPLVYPASVEPALLQPLRDACEKGQSSFFNTGIDPGFANDVLPLVLSSLSRSITSLRVTEMFNYATYPDREAVYSILGFGQPPEFEAFAAGPGMFAFGWGPVLHQIAAGLGVRVDSLDEKIERLTVEEGFDTPTGRIEAGTVGAMRSTLTAVIGGEPRLTVDHVTRMHDDLAPHWPQPHISISPCHQKFPGASGRGVYRVEIEGSPSIRCELELAEDADHDLGARVAGAAHMVNAIPAVHAAEPGLLSSLDLPMVTGAGTVGVDPAPAPDSRNIEAFVSAVSLVT